MKTKIKPHSTDPSSETFAIEQDRFLKVWTAILLSAFLVSTSFGIYITLSG